MKGIISRLTALSILCIFVCLTPGVAATIRRDPLPAGRPSPTPNPANVALNFDRQDVAEAQAGLSHYAQQVSDYIRELEARCAAARLKRGEVQARVKQLQSSIPTLEGSEKQSAVAELAKLKAWLAAEATMNNQAEKNVEFCQAWLKHQQAAVNTAQYNVDQDEQRLVDEQRKLQDQQLAAAHQAQMQRDAEYWRERNGDDYYGGYGGYGGYGRRGYGGYGGYGYGYRGHIASAGRYSGGGGGFHGGTIHVGIGGGHGGHR